MGSLVPGAEYVYERANGVTYARIAGESPNTRKPIGWESTYEPGTVFGLPTPIVTELVDIHLAAKANPALQQALDHVIMLHKLSKDYSGQTEHHK